MKLYIKKKTTAKTIYKNNNKKTRTTSDKSKYSPFLFVFFFLSSWREHMAKNDPRVRGRRETLTLSWYAWFIQT